MKEVTQNHMRFEPERNPICALDLPVLLCNNEDFTTVNYKA